jgi:hypothetical protein
VDEVTAIVSTVRATGLSGGAQGRRADQADPRRGRLGRIATCREDTGIDMLLESGAAEGVIAAAALLRGRRHAGCSGSQCRRSRARRRIRDLDGPAINDLPPAT